MYAHHTHSTIVQHCNSILLRKEEILKRESASTTNAVVSRRQEYGVSFGTHTNDIHLDMPVYHLHRYTSRNFSRTVVETQYIFDLLAFCWWHHIFAPPGSNPSPCDYHHHHHHFSHEKYHDNHITSAHVQTTSSIRKESHSRPERKQLEGKCTSRDNIPGLAAI